MTRADGSRPTEGRPSKYLPEYCDQLVEFYNQPSTFERIRTITTKAGTVIEETFEAPNKPRHVVDFCDSIGIRIATFYEWITEHVEFSEAYAHAKTYLERNIVDNALLSNYNPGFAGLVSKNWLGWKDKTEVDQKITGTLTAGTPDPKLIEEYAEFTKRVQLPPA